MRMCSAFAIVLVASTDAGVSRARRVLRSLFDVELRLLDPGASFALSITSKGGAQQFGMIWLDTILEGKESCIAGISRWNVRVSRIG